MSPPPLTFAAAVHGARLTLPLLPGIMVFAAAFGAAAAGKGMTFIQTVAMSGLVYAGAAQMVSLELWREAWTPSTILAIAAVTAVVNARMILMGAAIQPWLAPAPPARNALQCFFLTDASWLLGTRYHAEGGRDHGMLLGAGLALWVIWVLTTASGYLAGALVADPRRFGLDVLMPVFFAAMLVPLWNGTRLALPWAVAGAVALAVQALVPGYLFIIAGALAGMAAGAFADGD
jgi:predicted branched-subunit amino acid permease